MPVRLLREGILSSEAVCSLAWPAEVFYRRLISVVDDYGRFEASPKLLRSACYPLQIDKVSDSDIGKWLSACETAALVRVYPASDGKRYLEIVKFGQQIRAKRSKYPAPPSTDDACKQLLADAHLDEDEDEDDKRRVRAIPFDAAEAEIPPWLSRDTWSRWCADRKARKKPITPEGVRSQLKRLDDFRKDGISPEDVIEHSLASGYQGLFAPASRKPAQQPNTATPDVVETQERMKRMREDAEAARSPEAQAARVAAMQRIGRQGYPQGEH